MKLTEYINGKFSHADEGVGELHLWDCGGDTWKDVYDLEDVIVIPAPVADAVDAVIEAVREKMDVTAKICCCDGDPNNNECAEGCPDYILCNALDKYREVTG